MIDPHVHLRDWEQSYKETVKHGLEVAYKTGQDAIFEMPNTNPALTSRNTIGKRIQLADKALYEFGIKIFHGLYAGITANPLQIEEVVTAYKDFFPFVVGLKMFAGHSTGNMGIIEEQEQRLVYQKLADLDYRGVLAVHCEKESLMRPELWDPSNPYTHTLARPPEAEVESVKDQLRFAHEVGYKGTLHICHISVPAALEETEKARKRVDFTITCGLTPHHAVLYDEMMKQEDGLLKKMNPPLRSKQMQEQMLQALSDGRIPWVESDHATHTLEEKLSKPYASGIPGPFSPHFIRFLKEKGMSQERIDAITHDNIVKAFRIDIINTHREPDYNSADEYEYDAFKNFSF